METWIENCLSKIGERKIWKGGLHCAGLNEEGGLMKLQRDDVTRPFVRNLFNICIKYVPHYKCDMSMLFMA